MSETAGENAANLFICFFSVIYQLTNFSVFPRRFRRRSTINKEHAITTRKYGVVMHSLASVCLCVSVLFGLYFLKALTQKLDFWCALRLHLHNIYATFIYQGHRVKVKVTGHKRQTSATKYTHSRVICLRLKANLIYSYDFLDKNQRKSPITAFHKSRPVSVVENRDVYKSYDEKLTNSIEQ